MKLHMGTKIRFALMMPSVKFYSCEVVIIDERYLDCVYPQWRFSLQFWGATEGMNSLTEILND